MVMAANVRAVLAYVARKEVPLGIVYATDAKVGGVKVVGVFPENSHDPIIYPVAAGECQAGDDAISGIFTLSCS